MLYDMPVLHIKWHLDTSIRYISTVYMQWQYFTNNSESNEVLFNMPKYWCANLKEKRI